jgi:hypothetical protein
MKKVSIRQAILDAIGDTDEQMGRYPNQLLKWAKYIEKEIGSCLGYPIKNELFTITGCYLDLPADCYKVVGVIPGDWVDQLNIQYRDLQNPIVNIDEVSDEISYLWIPENTTWVSQLFWEEIGDQLHMIHEYNEQAMTLVYKYIPTDDKGYWLVNESHLDAIKKYLIYMMAYKFKWKMFKSDKLLRITHLEAVRTYKDEYNVAVRSARAEDGRESEFERVQY